MSRSGGTYSLPAGNPVVSGTTISSTVYNNTNSDIANELTNSWTRDGSALPLANIGMGGFKFTGLAVGSAAADSVAMSQLLLTRSARTSNTILGAADTRTSIEITSGSFTQTLTAAATLGSGWSVFYKNSGSGQVTFDPNASETIDGDATLIMFPGESWLIQCDGSNFNIIRLDRGSGSYLRMCETQSVASNAAEASMAAASTTTRTINTTLTNNLPGASLAANAITLSKAGTYLIYAIAPGGVVQASSGVSRFRAYLNDGSSNIISGTNASAKGDATNPAPNVANSIICGEFSIAASTTFTIKLSVGTGSATLMGGAPANFSTDSEIYTQVQIWRLA